MRPANVLRSSTFRLALIYIGLFSAVVLSLFGYVYWSTTSYIRERTDRDIGSDYASLMRAYDGGGRPALIEAIRARTAERGLDSKVYLLADSLHAPLLGNVSEWPSSLHDDRGWADLAQAGRDPNTPKRGLLRVRYGKISDGSYLLAGVAIDDFDELVGTIRGAFIGAIMLTFLLAGVASVTVTRRTVGRIEAINRTSEQILHGGLSSRIPVHGTRDEWDRLAENLNSMLDRIEGLVEEIRQVTNNVAHDLRTPLARMRGRLEQANNRQLDSDQAKALIGDVISDLDGVLATFASLLRIAQLEAQDNRRANFRRVDLVEVADVVAELFDSAAEEKGGQIGVMDGEPVYVMGDRDLLFEALSNLVDNAIQHGSNQVTVELANTTEHAVVTVSDRGPGIPVEEHKRVLKRFYRLERSRRSAGNGLGLSLVAAVAGLHNARIEMSDNSPGLRVALRFPRPLSPQPAISAVSSGREVIGSTPAT